MEKFVTNKQIFHLIHWPEVRIGNEIILMKGKEKYLRLSPLERTHKRNKEED